jgi:phosphotransferase system enzyme I (PtsP)
MVTAYEEVSRIRDHIIKVLRDLRRDGLTLKRPPIGVMIEVPSSINLIHKLASMVDFFCVGTNDLLQYYVASDRTNSLVQYLYQWCHPAFLMTLKGVSLSCDEAKRNVSICGEMAGEMWGSLVLVGLGFRLLSMDRQVIARHHDLMAQANVKPLEKLVAKLIQCNTVLEVLEQMQLFLDKWSLPPELKDLLQSELNNLIHPS